MTATRTQVLMAINRRPDGITSAELSKLLNQTAYNISGVCSKLWAHGKISRKPIEAQHRPVYAWLPKERQ